MSEWKNGTYGLCSACFLDKELKKLEAENQRLREALEQISNGNYADSEYHCGCPMAALEALGVDDA